MNYTDERELKRQLENERYERERAEEQLNQLRADRTREREQQLEAMRERVHRSQRTAANWPECLSKQAILFAGEAGTLDDDGTDYFADGAAACERALVLWREEEARVQPEIENLEQQLADLRASISVSVAERLLSESSNQGYKSVADALYEYDDNSCEQWLDW